MRDLSQWISASARRKSGNGRVAIVGALLLALAAVGVPAAAVMASASLAAGAPAPTFYVALD